jgi:hypothetical protein
MGEDEGERRERASVLFRLRNEALERLVRGDLKAVPLLRAVTSPAASGVPQLPARESSTPG